MLQSLFNLLRIRYCERRQGQSWEFAGEAREYTALAIDGVDVWKHEWQR